MKTNIVLLTQNRPALLRQTLVSLYTTTFTKDFTLTIIDDGTSDDEALQILNYYRTLSNVKLVSDNSKSHILAALKSEGVRLSNKYFGKDDFLLLIDNDVAFLPGWYRRLTSLAVATEPDNFRLWSGQVHPYHHPIDRVPNLASYEYAMLDSPAYLMRHATWHNLGGLQLPSSAAGVCQGEDVDFCNRLRASGYRIAVTNPHCILHCGLTNSSGKPAPGYDLRVAQRQSGIYYE